MDRSAALAVAATVAGLGAYYYYTVQQKKASRAFAWLAGRRVLIVRHGNTGKAAVDAERQLTEKGEAQCKSFKETYDLSTVAHSFCSPVKRTRQTSSLIGFPNATAVDALYFGNVTGEAHRAVERELGYAPISAYFDRARELFEPAGKQMANALDAAGSSTVQSPGDVLVVSHAMYLAMVCLEVVRALRELGALSDAAAAAGERVALSVNMGEVEGFEITSQGVKHLPNAVNSAAASGAPISGTVVPTMNGVVTMTPAPRK